MQIPPWLELVSVVSLLIGCVCAVVIILDLFLGHAQHMWIMNIVWPITEE
jgi:hypothetical protein